MTDLNEVDDGLDNWKNYYCDRKTQRITFSLEGRYKPDRKDIDYAEEALPPPKKPTNAALAIKYEKAITQLPFKYEACLVVDYMYRWALNEKHFIKTCKLLGVYKNEWDEIVRKAKLMLVNRFNKI